MKTFHCSCGNRVYFTNTICQKCNATLGFIFDENKLSTIEQNTTGQWSNTLNNHNYKQCRNYQEHDICNWMIDINDTNEYCVSCRMSEVIPNLGKTENRKSWATFENAKRRLLYTLKQLDLPLIDKHTDREKGISFRLMEDPMGTQPFESILPENERVLTGHKNGTITLNIDEADPVLREKNRKQLAEQYRTLLGHLRHESGHYYWDLLINNTKNLQDYRELFGDERINYTAALNNYYDKGPVSNWQSNWISAYACSHAWEDWAESWAHYLHMVDTLETAYDFGLGLTASVKAAHGQKVNNAFLSGIGIHQLISEWSELTLLLNELNRSMGLDDAYPFILSDVVIEKLSFIHRVITNH